MASLNSKKYGEFVLSCCHELSANYTANTEKGTHVALDNPVVSPVV